MKWTIVAVLAWLALLLAILAVPYLVQSPTLGDDLTRYTVRLALLYYALAGSLMLVLQSTEWTAEAGRGRLARLCWTLAWLAYLVHLAMAFHFYHHWSHADAMAHTREVSGVGEGIFVSHLFTLLWTLDVASWWLAPRWYAGRSPWIGRILHSFMAFVIFNGTVVYENGPIRRAGIVLFIGLACLLLYRRALPRHAAAASAARD
jgi:hypothetical protein